MVVGFVSVLLTAIIGCDSTTQIDSLVIFPKGTLWTYEIKELDKNTSYKAYVKVTDASAEKMVLLRNEKGIKQDETWSVLPDAVTVAIPAGFAAVYPSFTIPKILKAGDSSPCSLGSTQKGELTFNGESEKLTVLGQEVSTYLITFKGDNWQRKAWYAVGYGLVRAQSWQSENLIREETLIQKQQPAAS